MPSPQVMPSPQALQHPRMASEVTKEWVEAVLTHTEAQSCPRTAVRVISYQINPGCGKGDNFSSDVMRLEAEAEVTLEHGSASPRHYSFIVKFLTGNEFHQENMRHFGACKRELLMLSEVLPAYNTFQKERGGDKYHINAPRHMYSVCTDKDYVLVMEDLKEAGFHVEDKRRGLDLPHLTMAVRRLAHFQAVSYAYNRTHDFLGQFPDLKPSKILANVSAVLGEVMIQGIASAYKSHEEFSDLFKTVTANKEKIYKKLQDGIGINEKERLVFLSHGDFWINNVMFRHGEGGTPEDFMMIDWGNASWRSPVVDLHYILNSSTSRDLRRNHLEEIKRQYFDAFTSAVVDLGVDSPFKGFDDFQAEWRRTAAAGLGLGLIVRLVTLCEEGNAFSHGSLDTGLSSTIKTNFSKVVVRMLSPLYSANGIMRTTMPQQFKPLFKKLATKDDPEVRSIFHDLLTEAHQNGVLDA